MPVKFDEYEETHEEFEWTLQRGSNSHHILAFLADHPEQGFTPREIAEATGINRGSVGKTLQRLEERQLVRHAEPYWAFGDDDRVAAYVASLESMRTLEEREGTVDGADWEAVAVDPRES